VGCRVRVGLGNIKNVSINSNAIAGYKSESIKCSKCFLAQITYLGVTRLKIKSSRWWWGCHFENTAPLNELPSPCCPDNKYWMRLITDKAAYRSAHTRSISRRLVSMTLDGINQKWMLNKSDKRGMAYKMQRAAVQQCCSAAFTAFSQLIPWTTNCV